MGTGRHGGMTEDQSKVCGKCHDCVFLVFAGSLGERYWQFEHTSGNTFEGGTKSKLIPLRREEKIRIS